MKRVPHDSQHPVPGQPVQPPIFSRRALALFGVLGLQWIALAWLAVDWQVRDRNAAQVTRSKSEARQSLAIIVSNVERVLNRLQGLAAVLAEGSDVEGTLATFGPGARPSPLPHAVRKDAWTRQPRLAALNRQLQAATNDIGVDIIWLMNAAGDCVAASNAAERTSFVGTNYADRSYFRSAMAGMRGRQYAMGRVTKVPGLYFSAPVMAEGHFLGAVTVKYDLPKLADAVNHPYAFITDDQGVIILAADSRLEMRALPGAAVHRMPAEQRQSRYARISFDTLEVKAGAKPGQLARVSGSPLPHIALQREMSRHGITAHILVPVEPLDSLRGEAFAAFLLLSASGIMLLTMVLGARAYVLRIRHQHKAMETANESLKSLNERLDRLASTDPLTGCANRRHFEGRLKAELGRSGRYGRTCSVLQADIDHFKRINDRHGHSAGDRALCHFVDVVRRQLRGQDELGRMGGEEFAVLLPETALDRAITVAERIREAIAATPFQHENETIPLTASFGVACRDSVNEPPETLLRRADKALYAAKSAGRNRVVTAEPPAAPEAAAAGK